MVINVVGPPGAGKSTVIRAFRQGSADIWHALEIDDYRRRYGRGAWSRMLAGASVALRSEPPLRVLLESSGLATPLGRWLAKHPCPTIHITAPRETLLERLGARGQPPTWEHGSTWEMLVDEALERLPVLYPRALRLESDRLGPVEMAEAISRVLGLGISFRT